MDDFRILNHRCFCLDDDDALDIFKKRRTAAEATDYSIFLGCEPVGMYRLVSTSWKILDL